MLVKINATIPESDRESIRDMSVHYQVPIQKIVGAIIRHGIRKMTEDEMKRLLRAVAKDSPAKQYKRTKAF